MLRALGSSRLAKEGSVPHPRGALDAVEQGPTKGTWFPCNLLIGVQREPGPDINSPGVVSGYSCLPSGIGG